MTWLVWLYPPRWRRRYGAELASLIATEPFALRTVADVLGGAVDAWMHPSLAVSRNEPSEGGREMLASVLQLECAGYSRNITASDRRKSMAVNLVGTLTLTLAWVWLQTMYRSPYVKALMPMAYMAPYLFSLRYTVHKGRSAAAQTTFAVGFTAGFTLFFLGVAYLAARI